MQRWSLGRRLILLLAVMLSIGSATGQSPLTQEDASAFFDGLIAAQLAAHDIPGAVLVIVANGEIVLARGYGYADIESGANVDPDTTMFRIGSVSKLFTYTAAMQLVEQGRLDLDADVNTYLESSFVPATFAEPVTAGDLMTHTAGFEERGEGLFSRDPADMAPLDELLRTQLPARVRPPGELAGYSNHGVGLLGLIVERVSGEPWEAYIENHILEPLGMDATTGRQPPPSETAGRLSSGYRMVGGQQEAQPFTFVPLAPAGAIAASGTDMARFMIAHLQAGTYGTAQILQPETAAQMLTRRFGHDPRLPGIAHGFVEQQYGTETVLGHSGGMPNFISRLMLLDGRDVGLFVSYNSANGAAAQEELARAFIDRYFNSSEGQQSPESPAHAASPFVGTYVSTRRVTTGRDKFANIVQTLTVRAGDEGTLHFASPLGRPKTLQPVEGDLWRDVTTGERVVLTERDGVRHIFTANLPVAAYQALPWFATPGFHGLLFAISLVTMLTAILAAPIGAAVHARFGSGPSALTRWGRTALVVASLLFLAFTVALGLALTDFTEFSFGAPKSVEFLGSLLPLAAISTLVALGLAIVMWRRSEGSLIGRIHYTLVALAAAAFMWQLAFWNLLEVPGLGVV